MIQDAKPTKQRSYTDNDTFARKNKKEVNKLKEAKFIYEIEHTNWVLTIVMVPNKNEKLWVCMNLYKVNSATIRNNYLLPFTEPMLEQVVGKYAYSSLDGFLGYNQVSIVLKD